MFQETQEANNQERKFIRFKSHIVVGREIELFLNPFSQNLKFDTLKWQPPNSVLYKIIIWDNSHFHM